MTKKNKPDEVFDTPGGQFVIKKNQPWKKGIGITIDEGVNTYYQNIDPAVFSWGPSQVISSTWSNYTGGITGTSATEAMTLREVGRRYSSLIRRNGRTSGTD